MAARVLTDERVKARKLYVDQGITSFTAIASELGVDRNTISKWAKEESWSSQRSSEVTSIENITRRQLKILETFLIEIEEMQAKGLPISPKIVKQMKEMTDSIASLKKDFDERGGVIATFKKLIAFVTTLKGERELLKGLQRIAPGFFSYIER